MLPLATRIELVAGAAEPLLVSSVQVPAGTEAYELAWPSTAFSAMVGPFFATTVTVGAALAAGSSLTRAEPVAGGVRSSESISRRGAFAVPRIAMV